MKVVLDADVAFLIGLAVEMQEGVLCLRKNLKGNRNLHLFRDMNGIENIFVYLVNDFGELEEYLANFHLMKEKPRGLFVDLNVAKKEVLKAIALLASLNQVCDVRVFCIVKSFGSSLDNWNWLGRFFDEVFVAYQSGVSEIRCEKGVLSTVHIGDLNECIRKIVK